MKTIKAIKRLSWLNLIPRKLAIKNYSKAIKMDPKNASTYNRRGLANFALKKYRRALTDFRKAIKK